jgi:ATP/maltotriose-dependent transcriptional regulator MalT
MPRELLQRLGEGRSGGLSERETEVRSSPPAGSPTAEIGEELFISEATVKRHLANIYEKVGVRSRNEAVRTAIRRSG